MCVAIRPRISRHDRDIGLGLGVIVKRDRELGIDLPRFAESILKRGYHPTDASVVATALWLANHEQAVEQFDVLVPLEHAAFDQPLVLEPGPAARLQSHRLCRGHAAERSNATKAVNV